MNQYSPYVFLDTNTLLHFKRPDQIDWLTLLDTDSVTVVVTPALIDELEAQKTIPNRSRKLKKRAQSAILWLAQYMDYQEAQEIRPYVKLLFVRDSPTIDFVAYRLSQSVPDDQLIASALQFKQETGAEVCFASNDTGLRLKLPSRGLKGFTLPDTDCLPEEPDEAEREISQLKRELARHQSRLPKLDLTFSDSKRVSPIRLLKPQPPAPRRGGTTLALGGYEPQGNVEWRIKYEREHKNWEKTIARFLPCELALHNTGSAEASDIRIDFELPDFITAWASDEVPKAPKPPRSLFEPMDLSDIVPLSHHFRERPAGKPYTDYDNAAVWFRIPSLVHNRVLTCHRFFFKFSEEANIQNFSLPYIITCADLIDPITGTLGFVTKDEEGTEE